MSSFFCFGLTIAQEKEKDTLFLKLDNSLIFESQSIPLKFSLKDANTDEDLYFQGTEILNNLKPGKLICFNEFIHQPQFYDKTKTQKLKNYELVIFFRSTVVYLVRKKDKKTEYIKVKPILVSYD